MKKLLKNNNVASSNKAVSDEEETKCCICNKKESQDTKFDFLRECYKMNQFGQWDKGLMQPRLNFIELPYLRSGSNYVCHNRSRCRARQAKNSIDKRKTNLKLTHEN